MQNNLTGFANLWRLLYEQSDTGPVDSKLVTLGKEALPAILLLLLNERIFLEYEGSEEGTVGNAYKFRIKEFAAYYISKILRKPLE